MDTARTLLLNLCSATFVWRLALTLLATSSLISAASVVDRSTSAASSLGLGTTAASNSSNSASFHPWSSAFPVNKTGTSSQGVGQSSAFGTSTGGPATAPTASAGFAFHSNGSSGVRCPNGGSWQVWEESFQSLSASNWTTSASSNSSMTFGQDGITMQLSQSMLGLTVQSISTWQAPLSMSVVAKTDGAGGIVDAFILKPAQDTGEEIDLEIAGETFQLPVWVKGDYRLRKTGTDTMTGAKDLHQTLYHNTVETGAYFYRYSQTGRQAAFDPRSWNTYRLNWELDHITWSVGLEGRQKSRVRFSRLSDNYPLGPLPVRFGPWATDPATSGDWAGKLDWTANPNPLFKIKSLRLEGCRAT